MAAALQGVRATYVSYYPDLAVPGATDAIQSFTDLAVTSGVKHLVLPSGRGEPEAQFCEDIVRKSGVEWTLLRASLFAQDFSEAHFLERILAGEVALPVGNIGEPFVDADDIADATVAALAEDGHVGQRPAFGTSAHNHENNQLIDLSVLVSALGCGLMAGFFFGFSICVMRALGALPPAQGIAAMQSINVAVIDPWFLTPYFGMAVLCLFLIIAALLRWHEPGAAYVLAGGLLYFVGTFLVTTCLETTR